MTNEIDKLMLGGSGFLIFLQYFMQSTFSRKKMQIRIEIAYNFVYIAFAYGRWIGGHLSMTI